MHAPTPEGFFAYYLEPLLTMPMLFKYMSADIATGLVHLGYFNLDTWEVTSPGLALVKREQDRREPAAQAAFH